jgi:hypothetical protein
VKLLTTCLFAAFIVSSACMFAEPQAAQSSPKKKAARVITDEDLPSSSSSSHGSSAASQSAPTSEEPASSSSASSSTPAPAPKSNAPKSDNPQLAALQSRLDELQSDQANLVNGNESLKQDLAKEEDPKRREVLQTMLTNRQRSLERAKSEQSDINRKIDALKKK